MKIGFNGGLTIGFVMLKLTDNVSWSWFWVLSPMIIGLTLGAVLSLDVIKNSSIVEFFKDVKGK